MPKNTTVALGLKLVDRSDAHPTALGLRRAASKQRHLYKEVARGVVNGKPEWDRIIVAAKDMGVGLVHVPKLTQPTGWRTVHRPGH